MLDHFKTFARYNAWANRRLYAACDRLSDAEYFADRKAFFRSIHGTLNHLLLGDRLWFGRITGQLFPAKSLDQMLYDDRAALRAARAAEDARIVAAIDAMDPARLDGDLAYRAMAGTDHVMPMTRVLTHVFNHQTHHRGQAHGLLSQAGIDPPPLDLVYFFSER